MITEANMFRELQAHEQHGTDFLRQTVETLKVNMLLRAEEEAEEPAVIFHEALHKYTKLRNNKIK